MIDFNKMDSYKVAIDDGFVLNKKYFNENLEIKKKDGTYYMHHYVFNTSFTLDFSKIVCEKYWEDFKKKIADHFLNINSEVK